MMMIMRVRLVMSSMSDEQLAIVIVTDRHWMSVKPDAVARRAVRLRLNAELIQRGSATALAVAV